MAQEGRNGGSRAWRALRARAIRTLPHVCAHCGSDLDPAAPKGTPYAIEVDHIVPVSRGGQDTLHNVQLSCHPCNRRRGNRETVNSRQPPPPPRTYVTWRTW